MQCCGYLTRLRRELNEAAEARHCPGPLALDGAISMESVKHKGIHDPVAGQADILLVPFIEIGNVLYRSITYIAGKTMASTICGASCPVIITSRAATPDSKYYSILLAVLRCLKA